MSKFITVSSYWLIFLSHGNSKNITKRDFILIYTRLNWLFLNFRRRMKLAPKPNQITYPSPSQHVHICNRLKAEISMPSSPLALWHLLYSISNLFNLFEFAKFIYIFVSFAPPSPFWFKFKNSIPISFNSNSLAQSLRFGYVLWIYTGYIGR